MLINFNVFEFLLVAGIFALVVSFFGIGLTLISEDITVFLVNHSKKKG